MAKAKKEPHPTLPLDAPTALPIPQIGDKVIPEGSNSTWVVTQVSPSGDEVRLGFEGTNLERFRVRTDTLKFVDRVPRTSKPIAEAKTKLNAAKILERIAVVQNENLQRLDGDIAILNKYLKSEGVTQDVIHALENLNNEQHASWQLAVERIQELMEEE
jgi:hypothetical protein